MINVGQTLFSTILEKVDRLRFLADNDTEAFKKILYVVILRDLAEWTKYMGNQDCVYDKLNNKINEFILRNPEFLIERVSNVSNYTNVNTPQTIFTWQRLWDSQDVIYNREVEDPERSKGYEYDPDPTCNVSIVYFNSITIEGEPDIDRSKLSTCEKMNIFINRNTGEAWYLRPDGNWDRLKSDIDLVEWEKVTGAPVIYQGIKHTVNADNSAVDVELLEEGDSINSDVLVASTDSDLEDVL